MPESLLDTVQEVLAIAAGRQRATR
jgi:hypothetical protein